MKQRNPFAIVIQSLLLLGVVYMLLCGFGVTRTFWGWDSRHSEWWWKAIMVLIAASCVFIILFHSEMLRGGGSFLLLIAIAVGFAASTGFKFTSGDIKQRITYLDKYGSVADTSVLFNCYENFYHFKDNPEDKAYVIEYGELPGRNLWNHYILAGDIPKSTAPRANENYEWHTGAYEMELGNKNCR